MAMVLVNGGLYEVSKVEAIVEKRVEFNGQNMRLVQVTKDAKQVVSGLHFSVNSNAFSVFYINEFTIGNLKTDTVNEIMRQLASDGYYDFSEYDFQPASTLAEKYVFDEGKGKPYFLAGALMPSYTQTGIFNFPLSNISPYMDCAEAQEEFGGDDKKEDLSGMTDEQLRQTIYELEDTTMLRLGQMTREELEKEYDGIEVEMDE